MAEDRERAGGPAPMDGRLYNDNAGQQAKGGAHGLPLIARAVEALPLDGSVTIADYGSATGRNSLVPVGTALAALRRRIGPLAPVRVVHTDQPDNDFAALFRLLRDDPESYLKGDPQVFAAAVGRSFYEPLLPEASVDLGWCSFAIHWLSGAPPLPGGQPAGHVWPHLTAPAVRALFAAQAEADWRTFLRHRARELKPGGALIVVQPGLRAGDLTTFPVLMPWVQAELEAMEADGVLTAAERARMTFLVHERTAADARAPFADGPFAGLELVEQQEREMPDPFFEAYVADRDAARLARQEIGFFRAPFLPSLLAALDATRGIDDREAFTTRLIERLEDRIRAAPQPLIAPVTIITGLYRKLG